MNRIFGRHSWHPQHMQSGLWVMSLLPLRTVRHGFRLHIGRSFVVGTEREPPSRERQRAAAVQQPPPTLCQEAEALSSDGSLEFSRIEPSPWQRVASVMANYPFRKRLVNTESSGVFQYQGKLLHVAVVFLRILAQPSDLPGDACLVPVVPAKKRDDFFHCHCPWLVAPPRASLFQLLPPFIPDVRHCPDPLPDFESTSSLA